MLRRAFFLAVDWIFVNVNRLIKFCAFQTMCLLKALRPSSTIGINQSGGKFRLLAESGGMIYV